MKDWYDETIYFKCKNCGHEYDIKTIRKGSSKLNSLICPECQTLNKRIN